jgi:hypothetical protein
VYFVTICSFLLMSLLNTAMAQASGKAKAAVCQFQDGKEISIRYDAEIKGDDKPSNGKIWMPGGQPMWLFTQVDLSGADSKIPTGAYSLYLIPEKDNWTLIVNKNVKADAEYDAAQDVVRIPMPVGEVSGSQKGLDIVFGHVAPKQCNMRIYYGKRGTWAEFKEM